MRDSDGKGKGMNRNYQKELDRTLTRLKEEKQVKSLLLHSCCAPCSSYVIEYLSSYFKITVFYYNPNIYPKEEYGKRAEEQMRFIQKFPTKYPVEFLCGAFDSGKYYEAVKGFEQEKEGGERCLRCYRLRLLETVKAASRLGSDYFTTTLSISPLKNAVRLNEIGEELAAEYNVSYLNSDFKKRDGYKRSVELSKQYGLYRQDYCGCIFSKKEREAQEASKL